MTPQIAIVLSLLFVALVLFSTERIPIEVVSILLVMALVVSGLLNKQVGGELGISEITVKAHRGQVMRKMRADSLPALVHMVDRLGLSTAVFC